MGLEVLKERIGLIYLSNTQVWPNFKIEVAE